MYPDGFATKIVPGGPALAGLEDKFRPHFFGGVCTVVAKLLLQVAPDFATFGEKDYQQLKVVTAMARDLDIPTKIVGLPTVREKDGLAMSSRNAYLSAGERAAAPTLYRVLQGLRRRAQGRAAAGRRRWPRARRRSSAGRLCGGLPRSAPRRNAGADRLAQGRPGAAAGRGKARPHPADRQYRRLEQPEFAQFAAQRLRHVRRAARDPVEIGRRVLVLEIAPALERAIGPRPHRHAFRIEHQPAAADAVLVDERANIEDALAAKDFAADHPIDRAAAEDFLGALGHHAGGVEALGLLDAALLLLGDA